ncbi:MAG: serine/threonine-protein phosphatase [Acidobacteria bacterium]|nr:serine/threonine-protein phosphatase [Acidobacteriota bacterium]
MRIRIVWSQGEKEGAALEPAPSLRSEFAFRTDPGCHRELNEDSVRVVRPKEPEVLARKGLLALVADGMGGHEAGEVASGLAAEVVCREYYRAEGTICDALARALEEANREIHEQSAARRLIGGMGTTCTALVIAGGNAWAGHIGDSRVYLVRDGRIYRMTEDHSAVMDLVRKGILSAAEARRHSSRNVLQRAMGLAADLDADVWEDPFPMMSGDHFVLCSDGLHDLVDDGEIRDAVSHLEPEAACAELVRLARERGGYDNISVVTIAARGARVAAGGAA